MSYELATTIFVRWERVGFHRWQDAPGHRAYLRERHRHLFKFEVSVTVNHDDREIEFHDLLDVCTGALGGDEHGRMSCEQLAQRILERVEHVYPGRPVYSCLVAEDGECGARVVKTMERE